jgi:hypothetical protein
MRFEDWWRAEEQEMVRRDCEKGMHIPSNKCWTCRIDRQRRDQWEYLKEKLEKEIQEAIDEQDNDRAVVARDDRETVEYAVPT